MAKYLHLPLYQTAYKLMLELLYTTKNYPKEFKYSIGEKIQNNVIEIIIDIYKANSARNKIIHIKDILEKVQVVDLLLRISFDMKILSMEKYSDYIEKTASISKQANGWLNVCS